jgi:hypothetical protein
VIGDGVDPAPTGGGLLDDDVWMQSNRRLWALMAIERGHLPAGEYQELVHHVMSLLGLNDADQESGGDEGISKALDLLEERRRARR